MGGLTFIPGLAGFKFPLFGAAAIAFLHNRRANLLLLDFHVESMNQEQFNEASGVNRFWAPNDQFGREGQP
jgi:prepilin-type processing-associated H-X9-DG protein